MSRHLAWFFLAVLAIPVASAPLQALTYEVGGCKTGKSYVNFATISAAVVGVPAGSTIEVCPGVYPEQVTITQPLTLKGIAFNNANRSVIIIYNPSGAPLVPNVTSIEAGPVYAQVLVQNVIPAGPVNIIGITVDGAGGGAGCPTLAGIFYASGTSGTVNEVTTRNQLTPGCFFASGNGIWAENGAGPDQTITVENSSLHNFDSTGIQAISEQFPSTLTATIKGNFASNFVDVTVQHDRAQGIQNIGAASAITGNLITSGFGNTPSTANLFGIISYPDASDDEGNVITASGNTVADLYGYAIDSQQFGDTANSNKLSNVYAGLVVFVAVVESNTVMNTSQGYVFNASNPQCASEGTISGNVINDSSLAFFGLPLVQIQKNQVDNDDVVQMSTQCP
jgi:hypothetical protein